MQDSPAEIEFAMFMMVYSTAKDDVKMTMDEKIVSDTTSLISSHSPWA